MKDQSADATVSTRYHNQDGVKQINLYLSPQSQAELDDIKAFHGIHNNTEMMRFLIRQEARRIYAPSSTALPHAAPEPAA